MHRFIVDPRSVQDGLAEIRGPELHHLTRVLRLKTGDMVELIDPRGEILSGRLIAIDRSRARVEIISTRREHKDPGDLWLAVGILKGPRMDLIVEKAVEFGITTIIPLKSKHTNPGHYNAGRHERWQRLAAAACKQCGRAVPPEITEPMGLEKLLAESRDFTVRIMFYEGTGTVAAAKLIDLPWRKEGKRLGIIGPEGGFSREEADIARALGLTLAGLGHRVLRAETAAMAAMTLMRVFNDNQELE